MPETEARTVTFPPAKTSLISPERVDYMAKLFQVLFFALSLPYLFYRLMTSTRGTLQGATAIHAAA